MAVLLTAGVASAQTDLNKQLEVTREYTPKVGRADKLPVTPNMVDTVRLRPEISYSITPTAWPASFSVEPFTAASINTGFLDLGRSRFYVRAGFGAPFLTTADIYFTPRTKAGSTFGVFANHRGSFSKIKNDVGQRPKSTEMYNGLGLFGSRRMGRSGRYVLAGDLGYDMRMYNSYGAAGTTMISFSPLSPIEKQRYSKDPFTWGKARGSLSFGDTFTDLSRFNFSVGAEGGYAYRTAKGGFMDNIEQGNIDVALKGAQMFDGGRHGFEATLSERAAIGGSESDNYAVTVTLAPRYVMNLGRLRLRVGFDTRFVRNTEWEQKRATFIPAGEVSFDVAGGVFIPFASYTSQLLDGSPEALSRRNPYVDRWGPTGRSNDLRLGFSGNVGDIFTYKLSGGASFLHGYPILVADTNINIRIFRDNRYTDYYLPILFSTSGIDGTLITAGLELGLHNIGGFSARLSANVNDFDIPNYRPDDTPPGDLPRYDVNAEVAYSLKDKFSITVGAHFIGERRFMTNRRDAWDTFTARLEPVVDISLAAEVKVVHDFWVFLEGHNLADQKLYPHPYYPGLGVNVMAGIKAVF